jgi:hypothetical protein
MSLSGRSKAKLERAGFRIFYRVPAEKVIREAVNGSHRVHSRHKTKAEMDRIFAELMEDPKNLEI